MRATHSAIILALCLSGVSAGTMGGTAVTTLEDYEAGVTPTSVAIALTPATIVPSGGKITCTYDQDVFAAVATVTCAATPASANIACAATSTKVVEFTAATATFPATATSFAMTSNLAANFATGDVGVSCVSTTDLTENANAASFTTTQGAVGTLAITGGTSLTIATGTAIAYTGIVATNHVCWKAFTSVSAITAADCLVAGGATALGVANTVTCGVAGATGSFLWDEPTATNIAFIECSAGTAGFGAAADIDVDVTEGTAMTGTAATTLSTVVAGATPTSVAIALTPATIVPSGGKITCTYDQDVFAAVGTVTCAATPASANIACAATSATVVEFTAGSGTFLAAATSFAMTSNLAANYATGAVGVSCVSTTDVIALANAASYTTTAAPTPAPAPAPTPAPHSKRSKGISDGAIIGLVVGIGAVALLLGGISSIGLTEIKSSGITNYQTISVHP